LSRLRDGSRLRCRPRVTPGGTKQLYEVGPAPPVEKRTVAVEERRLRNLSVPTNRRCKTASSTPFGLTAFGRRTPEESRPPGVGDDCLYCRVGSVRPHSVVGPHRSGDGRWAMVSRVLTVRSPVRGPIQAGWGRACAAARRARSSLRSPSRSIAVAGVAPVRRVAPRAGPEFRVWASDAVHLFSFGAVLVLLLVRVTPHGHSRRQEPLGVERQLLLPQVVDGPAELRLQDRQRLALAALLLLTLHPRLGPG
jgi:hypothetical protein